MKADISLAERRRIERDQWAEIRAALAPRHFAAMMEEQAITAYWFAHALDAGPGIRAMLARMGCGSVPVAAAWALAWRRSFRQRLRIRRTWSLGLLTERPAEDQASRAGLPIPGNLVARRAGEKSRAGEATLLGGSIDGIKKTGIDENIGTHRPRLIEQ